MIKLCAFADEYDANLDRQIEGLIRNDVRLIEFRSAEGVNVADMNDEQVLAAYEKLTENGIQVWSIGSPLGKVDINCDLDEYMTVVERIARTAKLMRCDKIRGFSFYNAQNGGERVINYLGKAIEVCARYGAKIYHENEKGIYGDVPERVLKLKESLPELRLVFDPANYVQCGVDCYRAIDQLFPLTDYFHVKDALYSGDVVPAGKGVGALDRIFELLQTARKDFVLSVEPHLKVFSGFEGLERNGQMKSQYVFDSNYSAFDCACRAVKKLLADYGFKSVEGGYVRE